MNKIVILFLLLIIGNAKGQTTGTKIQRDFLNLANDTRPGCYWYWINDNISKTGITKDLEAMERVGIGRAFIGHIYDRRNETDTKPGLVKFMSEEWWSLVQWAVKEADRCNIDIGFFNAPGWSQSGGPWIKTSESMRYLANSDTTINGGRTIKLKLSYPQIKTYPNTRAAQVRTGPNFTGKDFQQVSVVAFKTLNLLSKPSLDLYLNEAKLIRTNDSVLTAIPVNREQVVLFQSKNQSLIQASNLMLAPQDFSFKFSCKIEASTDGKHFKQLATYEEERGHQGPKKLDPLVVPFKLTAAKVFRVTFLFKPLATTKQVRLKSISLTNNDLLGGYVRKQLGETSPFTKIPWDAYTWTNQIENKAIDRVYEKDVLDITKYVDKNGVLSWKVPPGNWTIQRFGMVPIGTQCHPCGPESLGFEVDKLNAVYIKKHFEAMVGEFLHRTKPEDRKALKYVISDSYETGPQNWTDGFIEKFKKKFNYSPVSYLPVLTGRIIGNEKTANRFLWDLRKLITESVAEEYVGGLRKICNEHGLKLWLENYGHWGFPSEFLLYGSKSDEIGGEIWESSDPINNVECRAAASASHIYGKNDVFNEVFTSNRNFRQNPASLKRWADWSYSAGINHMILHVYIHQPDERKPGIIEWFGTAFNRHNTWFEQSKPFIDYMRRSAVMLKSGTPVADVAYYIGENSPSMTGAQIPALPSGYDFDFINSDVLINQAKVEKGRIQLNSGVSYAVLVLPPITDMRLEVATAIKRLVANGAIIIGQKPENIPTLSSTVADELQLKQIANELWPNQKSHQYGLGWIYQGTDLETVLRKHNIEKDVALLDTPHFSLGVAGDGKSGIGKTGAILFKHRSHEDADIFFIANTTHKNANLRVAFRTDKTQPYIFNAVTGKIEKMMTFKKENERIICNLNLETAESTFIFFTNETLSVPNEIPNTSFNASIDLDKDWNLEFKGDTALNVKLDTLIDWSKAVDPSIKYFSGTASYTKSFSLKETPTSLALLNLGNVDCIATITLNGKEVGTLWTNPWAIDVTNYLKSGVNTIKIDVTNDWNNRLVGDILKKTTKPAYVSQPYSYDKKEPLLSSGLLGPISLKYIQIVK